MTGILIRHYMDDMRYFEGTDRITRGRSRGYDQNTYREYSTINLWDAVWTLTIL